MKQTFDTDAILFGILNGTAAIKAAITGGIYVRVRPSNSVKEDIVVNTIDLTQDSEPQIGTSNINIHVADKIVTVGGSQQTVPDTARLKLISGLVFDAIRAASIPGLKILPGNQTTIQEVDIKQHYSNIRVSWNIH